MTTQLNTIRFLVSIFLLASAENAFSNAYVIIYATSGGNTGHAGIAVQRYDVVSYDVASSTNLISSVDTVSSGKMYYYDLWPKDDVFIRGHFGRDLQPYYYKLPQSSSEADISLYSLMRKGIPHKEDQPVDGIIEINTTPKQDLQLIAYFDGLIDHQRPFNARTFNCVDFVLSGLNHVLNLDINAREFVPLSFCSTPNKLFRKIAREKKLHTEIIADPGIKVRHSFFSQKVIPEAFRQLKRKLNPKNNSHDESKITLRGGFFSHLGYNLCPGT